MYKIINLEQGSKAWHDFRASHIGASDIPSIIGVGFLTPYKLWQQKLGLYNVPDNAAMERGRNLEAVSRDLFTKEYGVIVEPIVLECSVRSWMSASLDGFSLDGKTAIEIKCPGKKDHDLAKQGIIPDKYIPQLQWQLAVTKLDSMFYISFDGKENTIIEVKKHDDYIDTLIREGKIFYDKMINLEPPELKDKDYGEIDNRDCLNVLERWVYAKQQLDAVKALEKSLKEEVIKYVGKSSSRGSGVRITYFKKKGNIDLSKANEEMKKELEKLRKEPVDQWRFTIEN